MRGLRLCDGVMLYTCAGELLKLFQDCKLVMRWDVQTCLFLMPYIIHTTLDAGQDAARDEVLHILAHSCTL